MLRTIAIITVLLAEVLTLSAQPDICFTYDAAGNRTIRQLCRVSTLNADYQQHKIEVYA